MGLFDNFSNVRTTNNTDLSPAESFAGVMLATIAADEYLAREEINSLVTTLHQMKLFQSYPSESISRMIDKLMKIIQVQSIDLLLDTAVKCLPEYFKIISSVVIYNIRSFVTIIGQSI